MNTAKKVVPAPDPAGLDQLLLAAGKGVTRFVEQIVSSKFGRPVQLWDGADGLGAVLKEHIDAAGIPNQRLPELLTPRAVVDSFTPIVQPIRRKRPARRVR